MKEAHVRMFMTRALQLVNHADPQSPLTNIKVLTINAIKCVAGTLEITCSHLCEHDIEISVSARRHPEINCNDAGVPELGLRKFEPEGRDSARMLLGKETKLVAFRGAHGVTDWVVLQDFVKYIGHFENDQIFRLVQRGTEKNSRPAVYVVGSRERILRTDPPTRRQTHAQVWNRQRNRWDIVTWQELLPQCKIEKPKRSERFRGGVNRKKGGLVKRKWQGRKDAA